MWLFVFSLPKGIQFGRKEISEVAERRKHDIKTFLDGLFGLPESVAHCDLVYTFFHPILRDQEEANIRQRKMKGNLDINLTAHLNSIEKLSPPEPTTLIYTFYINRWEEQCQKIICRKNSRSAEALYRISQRCITSHGSSC